MSIHLLPPFETDEPLSLNSGEWTGEPTEFIHIVANRLRTVRDGVRADDMVSIPDLWAQVIAFEASLFEENHLLHKRSVGEWRGLLTIFALSSHRSLGLTVSSLPLKEMADKPYDRSAKDALQDIVPFARLAHQLKPTAVLANGQNWETIGAIGLDEQRVGLLVPSTLVCPARNYAQALDRQKVVWLEGDRLSDPCQVSGLTGIDYTLIRHFIEHIRQGYSQAVAANGNKFGFLRDLMDSFIDDLKSKESKHKINSSILINSEQSSFSLPPQQPIYPLLQKQFRIRVERQAHLVIKPRQEYISFIKGAILIDFSMPERMNCKAEDIFIWESYSLDQIIRQPRLIERINEEASQVGYLILQKNQIFSNELRRFSGQPIVSHPLGRAAQSHTVPLRSIILIFMTADEIRESFKLEENGSILFANLKLKLIDEKTGASQDYDLSEEFKNSLAPERDRPQALDAWPDFSSKDWRYHFLFSYVSTRGHKATLIPMAVASTLESLQPLTSPSERLNRIRTLTHKPDIRKTNVIVDDQISRIVVSLHESEVEGVTWQESQEDAGLILMPPRKRPVPSSMPWKIGIDFGTTNTMVYGRCGTDDPRPINFTNHLLSPFSAPIDKATWEAFAQRHAVLDQFTPFLTALRPQGAALHAHRLPILNDIILNIKDLRQTIKDICGPSSTGKAEQLKFNLKWSRSPANAEQIQIFLAQTVLQAMAEVVSEGAAPAQISFFFSFPEAFSSGQLDGFKQLVSSAVAIGFDPRNKNDHVEMNPSFRSESICSAYYFYNKKRAAFASSVITFDIGGKTTDITLWQNNKAIWGTSIVLASQHIFINFLKEKPHFLEKMLGNKTIYNELKALYTDKVSGYDHRNGLEVLINTKLNTDDGGLSFPWNSYALIGGESEAQSLDYITELSFAGILFYIGQMIRYLHGTERFNSSRDSVQICIGGRGSLMFKRLFSNGQESKSIAVLPFFQKVAGLTQCPALPELSENPKHEVAYGLLDDLLPKNDDKLLELILGEELLIDGVLANAESNVISLNPDQDWRIKDLTMLRQFIGYYESMVKRKVAFDSNDANSLIARVTQELAEVRDQRKRHLSIATRSAVNQAAQVVEMEPVFIMALRELISCLIKKNNPITPVDQ